MTITISCSAKLVAWSAISRACCSEAIRQPERAAARPCDRHHRRCCRIPECRRAEDQTDPASSRTCARSASSPIPAVPHRPGHPGRTAQARPVLQRARSAGIEARRRQHQRGAEAYHAVGLDDEVLAAFGVMPIPPALQSWNVINERGRNRRRRYECDRRQYTGMKTPIIADRGAVAWWHRQRSRSISTGSKARCSKRGPRAAPRACQRHPGARRLRRARCRGQDRAAQSPENVTCRLRYCFGMQMAVIEAARNLVGTRRRAPPVRPHPEPLVGLMTEWLRGNELEKRSKAGDLGGTMRLGAYPAVLKRGSRVSQVDGGATELPSVIVTATRSTPPTGPPRARTA